MKKKGLYLLPLLLMTAFILFPSGAANLYIRIYFDEIEGDACTLYYATDTVNVFCIEQHLSSGISQDTSMAEFCVAPSLDGHITGFRLDFPNAEQLLSIRNITISSGGVIKRQYNPCDFFADDNIASTNNIDSITLATASGRTYIGTSPEESYLVLSDALCRQITDCYSHFRLTKAAVCLFLLACFYLARRKLFGDTCPLPAKVSGTDTPPSKL